MDTSTDNARVTALGKAVDHHHGNLNLSQTAETVVETATAFHDFLTTGEPVVTYDDNTLFKVREALGTVVTNEAAVTDAVSAMQSAGILFRERA